MPSLDGSSDRGDLQGELLTAQGEVKRLAEENATLKARLRSEKNERMKAIDIFQENEQDLLENFKTAIDFLEDVKKTLNHPQGASPQVMGRHGTMEDDLLFIKEVAQGLHPKAAAKMDVRKSLADLTRNFDVWKTWFREQLREAYVELDAQAAR